MGSDPATAPRYYYVYNGHGDVVALVDASGASVASYSYDAFGQLSAASENFGGTTTWTNPYRYDGRDGVRYDGETGLSWMSVRAYDPALGRFLSRDPLGRVPLFFADQPYVYGGNNPLVNVDPSGQFAFTDGMSHAQMKQERATFKQKYVKWFRMQPYHPIVKKSVVVNGHRCYTQECVRKVKTDELSMAAGRWLAGGIIVQIIAAAVDWLSEGTLGKLERTISIAMLVIQLVPAIGQAIGGASGPLYEFTQKLAAGMNWVAQIATQAIAAYRTLGWLAQHAIDATVFAVQSTVNGLPGAVEGLALKAFGRAFALALSGGALYFMGQYNAVTAENVHELDMSISTWCSGYGGGVCAGLPAN